MGVKEHFTGSIIIGDDEGEEMEFQSHTEMQTALVMLARRDVICLQKNRSPSGGSTKRGLNIWS